MFIRTPPIAQHRACMIAAFVYSTLFLISYLIYHSSRRLAARSPGQGAIRVVYYTILITHVILAAAILPLC